MDVHDFVRYSKTLEQGIYLVLAKYEFEEDCYFPLFIVKESNNPKDEAVEYFGTKHYLTDEHSEIIIAENSKISDYSYGTDIGMPDAVENTEITKSNFNVDFLRSLINSNF